MRVSALLALLEQLLPCEPCTAAAARQVHYSWLLSSRASLTQQVNVEAPVLQLALHGLRLHTPAQEEASAASSYNMDVPADADLLHTRPSLCPPPRRLES